MRICELKLYPVSSQAAMDASLDHDLGMHGMPSLPSSIGPHENKEIGLMLLSGKPMALMSLQKYRRNLGEIKRAGFISMRVPMGMLVAQPYYRSEMQLAANLIKRFREGLIGKTRYHIGLGKLLGYNDDQIRSFLRHISR